MKFEITNHQDQITKTKYYTKEKSRHSIGHLGFGIWHLKFPAKRGGFTLIELLIVITIIGILVSIGLYSWGSAQQKARDNRRKTDLKSIQQALENFYQFTGKYPPSSSSGGWCTQISNTTIPDVLNALQGNYIAKIPQDPTNPNSPLDYFYNLVSPTQYRLYSTLENSKDPEYIADALGTDGLSGCPGANANYHYKVTNF